MFILKTVLNVCYYLDDKKYGEDTKTIKKNSKTTHDNTTGLKEIKKKTYSCQ